uniref:Uncharacterized protein n=2 Tax=Avena sativa TaxID=4498 RepID=A0ACD5TZT8_AVESA
MSTLSARRRRRHQIRARGRRRSSVGKRKKDVIIDGDVSPGAKRLRYSEMHLPEDIWGHIHSLMPLRDAARTACVSRAFSQSWRSHPNLNFTNKSILGSDSNGRGMDLIGTINRVLENHSGINVKTLTLELLDHKNALRRRLDSWLEISMSPGIEEITISLGFHGRATYKFPCRLLSDRITNSVRCLKLQHCVFCPTAKLGPFRSLAVLRFSKVRITGYRLGCILSNSLALESLELNSCDKLDCLKIPCQLQRLSYLKVFLCQRLYAIEIKAPNLRVFILDTEKVTEVSLGVPVKLKMLYINSPDIAGYTDSRLLSNVPDLESLNLQSWCQVAASPLMLPVKFVHLKEFNLSLTGQGVSGAYDYFSLASLLDCCPSLENIFLNVSHKCIGHETMSEDPARQRQKMPGQQQQHGNLKSVTILGFCYAKSLVELTCYIVEKAASSLESLTLDIHGTHLVSVSGIVMRPMYEGKFEEAPRTLSAIRTYIQGKIPSTAKLNVLEPCGGPCNAVVGQ